ncbi:hypothetical protein L7E55_17175 [Pelotomaculum isophthalicicum JI]|uniref:Lipoprotein n=1 Tax=Pelotomaculum isophthalicicum JI TaxID=947010 RepID=A0A9X4JWS0_9FIRM|nr:hypothetical protein [Pelotomaculum isophthalicicum]MDF9410047.1 hypothetical protein [Pelotomaculum isophthalicicum JI]
MDTKKLKQNILALLLLFVCIVISGCSSKSQSQPSSQSSSNNSASVSNQASSKEIVSQHDTTQPQSEKIAINQISNFKFVGCDQDKVNETYGGVLKPDGKLDGHFNFTISLKEPLIMDSVYLENNEFGKRTKWAWHKRSNSYYTCYKAGLYLNGSPVEHVDGDKETPLPPGEYTYDLYVSPYVNHEFNWVFKDFNGKDYELTVYFTNKKGEQFDLTSKTSS